VQQQCVSTGWPLQSIKNPNGITFRCRFMNLPYEAGLVSGVFPSWISALLVRHTLSDLSACNKAERGLWGLHSRTSDHRSDLSPITLGLLPENYHQHPTTVVTEVTRAADSHENLFPDSAK